MKKLWIFVGICWLVVLPLIWWEPQTRAMSTLASGVTVDVPAGSQSGLFDIAQLLKNNDSISHIKVAYGWKRDLLFIYPDTAVIVLTAPWFIEKTRYPLIRSLERRMNTSSFTPLTASENAGITSVQAWVYFEGDVCVTDQLVSLINTSEQHLELVELPLPADSWMIRSHSGQPLDHGSTKEGLHVLLEKRLPPLESVNLLLTRETPVTTNATISFAETIILQPQDMKTRIHVKREEGLELFDLTTSQGGYWRLLLSAK